VYPPLRFGIKLLSNRKIEKENLEMALPQNNGIELLNSCKLMSVPPTILALYVMK